MSQRPKAHPKDYEGTFLNIAKSALLLLLLLDLVTLRAHAIDTSQAQAKLTATQIVDKNVAARGGLQAWRAVQSLSMSGKMEAGGNDRPGIPMPGEKAVAKVVPHRPAEQVQLPFVLDLKRPRKMRLELQFNGQTALQVFDGSNGWKLRPFLNRREVENYSEAELKSAASEAELDGFLVDYAEKGTKVELDGTEKVEDRDTYRLKLTLKGGQSIHLWVDAETFLETKLEGHPRRLDGKYYPVEVYYRDFRSVQGLKLPYLLETVVKNVPGVRDPHGVSEKITIEQVQVNPKLEDALFAKPKT
jgi:outer membrane lipoprotein-sorting protein